MKTFRQYLKEWWAPYRFVWIDKYGDVGMIEEIDAKDDNDAIRKARAEWDKHERYIGDINRDEWNTDDDDAPIKELHVKRRVGKPERNEFQTIKKIY